MKKAKIMLTAITLLAVVGGALAFKASNFNGFKVWCKDSSNQDICSIESNKVKTTDVGSVLVNCTDAGPLTTTCVQTYTIAE